MAVGTIVDPVKVIGARPALMMIWVEREFGDLLPAKSETTEVKVHVPLDIALISQKVTVPEYTNEHEATSALEVEPLTVAVSPIETFNSEIFGVASSEVGAPLSSMLKGALLAAGAMVSITATWTGVGLDALLATSVMTAEIFHVPSPSVGKVHVRSDAPAVKEHCTFWPLDEAVTTTRSVTFASETETVGVLSLVIPSVALIPVSEVVENTVGFVADGAIVSMVMVNSSEAATMSPAINCRARYAQVPSASDVGVHVSDTFCGMKLHTTLVNPVRVKVTVVSTDGTKSSITTVGEESDKDALFTTTGIPTVIALTVMSPLETAELLGR